MVEAGADAIPRPLTFGGVPAGEKRIFGGWSERWPPGRHPTVSGPASRVMRLRDNPAPACAGAGRAARISRKVKTYLVRDATEIRGGSQGNHAVDPRAREAIGENRSPGRPRPPRGAGGSKGPTRGRMDRRTGTIAAAASDTGRRTRRLGNSRRFRREPAGGRGFRDSRPEREPRTRRAPRLRAARFVRQPVVRTVPGTGSRAPPSADSACPAPGRRSPSTRRPCARHPRCPRFSASTPCLPAFGGTRRTLSKYNPLHKARHRLTLRCKRLHNHQIARSDGVGRQRPRAIRGSWEEGK